MLDLGESELLVAVPLEHLVQVLDAPQVVAQLGLPPLDDERRRVAPPEGRMSFAVERTIRAGAGRVWSLLVGGPSYPSWNPTVISLRGRIADGERIELVSTLNPKRTFKLSVSVVVPARGMVWQSGMPLGLFRGVRTSALEPVSESETVFSMREDHSGPLAGLITKTIPDMTESFADFADSLMAAAEKPGG